MRPRALLVLPVLVAAALGLGAASAPAATLFASTAHTARVPIGGTTDAVLVGNFDFTSSTGLSNRCTGGGLHLIVGYNNIVQGVDFRVVSGTFTGCDQFTFVPTFTTPWTVNITGNATQLGPTIRYAATMQNVAFDINLLGGQLLSGNLTTGVTAQQPVVGTSPITLNFANAGTTFTPTFGTVSYDGSFRLTTPWSLTN